MSCVASLVVPCTGVTRPKIVCVFSFVEPLFSPTPVVPPTAKSLSPAPEEMEGLRNRCPWPRGLFRLALAGFDATSARIARGVACCRLCASSSASTLASPASSSKTSSTSPPAETSFLNRPTKPTWGLPCGMRVCELRFNVGLVVRRPWMPEDFPRETAEPLGDDSERASLGDETTAVKVSTSAMASTEAVVSFVSASGYIAIVASPCSVSCIASIFAMSASKLSSIVPSRSGTPSRVTCSASSITIPSPACSPVDWSWSCAGSQLSSPSASMSSSPSASMIL
mmetsp:Transcript_10063/g.27661  ORF Transcript_10063/g.27661 Transcript_10063/m.27661 type:complete len:283 (-) Transcript_10063:1064-1912(-)